MISAHPKSLSLVRLDHEEEVPAVQKIGEKRKSERGGDPKAARPQKLDSRGRSSDSGGKGGPRDKRGRSPERSQGSKRHKDNKPSSATLSDRPVHSKERHQSLPAAKGRQGPPPSGGREKALLATDGGLKGEVFPSPPPGGPSKSNPPPSWADRSHKGSIISQSPPLAPVMVTPSPGGVGYVVSNVPSTPAVKTPAGSTPPIADWVNPRSSVISIPPDSGVFVDSRSAVEEWLKLPTLTDRTYL